MADDVTSWPHGETPPQLDPDGPDRLFSTMPSATPPPARPGRRRRFRIGGVWIAAAAMAAFMLVVGGVAVVFHYRQNAVAATVDLLAPGHTVGLEATDEPGFRIRHYNSEAWLNPVTADSKDLDRADARWIVHEGLADKSCVSFESDNYRGQYLRHFNSRLRRDPPDGSELFQADATFCPEASGADNVVVLRSFNFPDRYLVRKDDAVWLADAGTAGENFTVQPPL